ncbi:MAG: hypothetical protein HQ485_05570 [Acidobacteria bacterium]|nr:hypothetical protein [Acidobacteriota bacterium]
MKKSLVALVVITALIAGPTLAAQQQAPPTQEPPAKEKPAAPVDAKSPAGKWVVALNGPDGMMSMTVEVKIDAANKVTGTLVGEMGPTPIAGEVKEGVLGFSMNFDAGGQMIEVYFEGAVKEDGTMAGSAYAADMAFPFTATRPKGL